MGGELLTGTQAKELARKAYTAWLEKRRSPGGAPSPVAAIEAAAPHQNRVSSFLPAPTPTQRINEAVPPVRRQVDAQQEQLVNRRAAQTQRNYHQAMEQVYQSDPGTFAAIMRERDGISDTNLTPAPIRQRYDEMRKADAQTKMGALGTGIGKGLLMVDSKAQDGTNLTGLARDAYPISFGAGRLLGQTAGQKLLYNAVTPLTAAAQQVPAVQNALNSLKTPTLQKLASGGMNLAGQQLADTVVQTPRVIWEGVERDKPTKEIARDVARQQAGDLLFNAGFAGIDALRRIPEPQPRQRAESLTRDEEYAINQYISAKSYGLNAKLRDKILLNQQEKQLLEGLGRVKMKLPSYEGETYRSISSRYIDNWQLFDQQHQPGKVVIYDAFTSTARNVYDPEMDVQFVIRGKSGRALQGINEAEQEVLFWPGSRFMVVRREGNTIYLQEVSSYGI